MRWTNRHGWPWHSFRAVALATTAAMVFATTGVRAADPPPLSNIDLLTQMTQEIVEEMYAKFGPELGGRSITLHPFAAGEDYVFVGNIFANVLTSKDVKTILPVAASAPANTGATGAPATGAAPNTGANSASVSSPSETAADGVVLTFQNVAFGLAYPDVYRAHVFGGKHVKRRADVRIHATITDAHSGQVLWVGEGSREHADEFDMDDSARIEQGVYQFARPVLPGGGLGKYAEPVFVTGIIVGLIYLFFSNQSDN